MRSSRLMRCLFLLADLVLWPAAARTDCASTSQLVMCKVPAGSSYQSWTYDFLTPAGRESTDYCWVCHLPGAQCEGVPQGSAQVTQFDIPAGIVYASTNVFDMSLSLPALGATSHDQYWITGPVSASPVTCTARFEVGGYGGCYSMGTASMTVQGQIVSASYDNALHLGPCGQPPPISGALTQTVTAAVGQPFDVTLSAQITRSPSNLKAYVYGLLSFRDLPSGYAVVSCNGFGGVATRTLTHTWGRLKSRYR